MASSYLCLYLHRKGFFIIHACSSLVIYVCIVCHLKLAYVIIRLFNLIFCRNNDGIMVNTMSIVSGIVTSLEIPVSVRNNGDDAFGARITVTYSSVLIFSRAAPANEVMYWIEIICSNKV